MSEGFREAVWLHDAVAVSRQHLQVRGRDFVLWGWFIASGYLGAYAILEGYWRGNMFALWCVCIGVPLLYSSRGVIFAALGFSAGPPPNPLTRAMRETWWACALAQIALFVSGNLVTGMPMGWFAPVSIAILGIDFFVTGILCELVWFRRLAYGWWAGAMLLFATIWTVNQALLAATLMVCFMAIPGHHLARSLGVESQSVKPKAQ